MPAVKGSKQQQMIVVPRRWWHGGHGSLLLGLSCALAILLVFWLGSLYGESDGSALSLINKLSIARMAESRDTINSLREQLIKAEQASTVDRVAMQELRVNIQRLRQQISQLEEDVLFYKQISDSGTKETGLVVSAFNLATTPQTDRFRYKIKFEKIGNPNSTLDGYANISVTGVKDNMELSLPLSALSNSSQGDNIKLRFRAFQDVEGEITLPFGFEPSRIEIVAVAEGPESKTIQRNFSWLAESGQQAIAK